MKWLINSESNPKQTIIRNHNDQRASQAFKEHENWLSKHYPGMFVLICDAQMVDIYDSYEGANKDGLIRFGEKGFSVKKIDSL